MIDIVDKEMAMVFNVETNYVLFIHSLLQKVQQ